MAEKTEILWAYEHKDVIDQNHVTYRTGTNNLSSVWPNQSCKEDDLDLFYFKPKLIHYLEAVKQPLPFVFPISLRYFIGGHSTSVTAYRRQIVAFDWIPAEVLEACRNYRCVLYFEDRFEGYPDYNGLQVKYFNDLAKRLQIPTDRIIVSTGNAKMPEIAKTYNTGITFVHEDWFRAEFWDRKIRYNPPLEHDVDLKNKLYLCYNRHWNDNRQSFVYELWKAGLLDQGLVSLPAADEKQRMWIKSAEYWKPWVSNMIDVTEVTDHMDEYLGCLPLILDNPTFENMANQSNNAHYLQTYMSVITETWGDNTTVFVTEKTYKAIMAEHPFMVLSSHEFLKYLKFGGFETFHEFIDESYDEEPLEGNRARMIVAEIKKLSQKTPQELRDFWYDTKEIARHNRKILATDPGYGKNLYRALMDKYVVNGNLK